MMKAPSFGPAVRSGAPRYSEHPADGACALAPGFPGLPVCKAHVALPQASTRPIAAKTCAINANGVTRWTMAQLTSTQSAGCRVSSFIGDGKADVDDPGDAVGSKSPSVEMMKVPSFGPAVRSGAPRYSEHPADGACALAPGFPGLPVCKAHVALPQASTRPIAAKTCAINANGVTRWTMAQLTRPTKRRL
ncbi:hypothetical protein MRX96_002996 [Rhipicephalus microplus]